MTDKKELDFGDPLICSAVIALYALKEYMYRSDFEDFLTQTVDAVADKMEKDDYAVYKKIDAMYYSDATWLKIRLLLQYFNDTKDKDLAKAMFEPLYDLTGQTLKKLLEDGPSEQGDVKMDELMQSGSFNATVFLGEHIGIKPVEDHNYIEAFQSVRNAAALYYMTREEFCISGLIDLVRQESGKAGTQTTQIVTINTFRQFPELEKKYQQFRKLYSDSLLEMKHQERIYPFGITAKTLLRGNVHDGANAEEIFYNLLINKAHIMRSEDNGSMLSKEDRLALIRKNLFSFIDEVTDNELAYINIALHTIHNEQEYNKKQYIKRLKGKKARVLPETAKSMKKEKELEAEVKRLQDENKKLSESVKTADEQKQAAIEKVKKKSENAAQNYEHTISRLKKEIESQKIKIEALEWKEDADEDEKEYNKENYELDYDGRYVFICMDVKGQRVLKNAFPNSQVKSKWEISNENSNSIDAVVCVTTSIHHSDFKGSKNITKGKDIPYVMTSSRSPKRIAYDIAKELAKEKGK